MNKLKPTVLYYNIINGGDGSAYPKWFLTGEDAEHSSELEIESYGEGWSEACTGSFDSYIGSSTYAEAVENSTRIRKAWAQFKMSGEVDY